MKKEMKKRKEETGLEERDAQSVNQPEDRQPKVEKTGFLSRENLYSHINVSLRAIDCFIAVLVVFLIVAIAAGLMQ